MQGNLLAKEDGEIRRITSFIPNSICFEKVESAEQAYEAAKTISEFHSYLLNVNVDEIHPSIVGFLDYHKRVNDFKNASIERLEETIEVAYILDNLYQVEKYLEIDFPKLVVHADAKISNFYSIMIIIRKQLQ